MLPKILSLVALAITIVPCLLFFFGLLDQETMKWIALAGTIFWFIVTPLWMGREVPGEATRAEI